MGKLKHAGFALGVASDDVVKPLIPSKDKFKKPPKKKFRLKLRFSHNGSIKTEPKIKVEPDTHVKPIIPYRVKQEPVYVKPEPPIRPISLKREEASSSMFWGSGNDEVWHPLNDDLTDPTYSPLSDEFSIPSSDDDDSAYYEEPTHAKSWGELSHTSTARAYGHMRPVRSFMMHDDEVLQATKINSRKSKKVKKERKKRKTGKPRRRYKRRVLTEFEKLQASRRRRTCLVKKPKSEYLGVSWCNTKNTWVARVWHPTERKLIWAGYHSNERACALAVNEKCLDLNIPLKNPHILSN